MGVIYFGVLLCLGSIGANTAKAQSAFQFIEHRTHTISSMRTVVADFSGYGTGDVLSLSGEVRNIQTPVFQFFSQSSSGNLLRSDGGPSFLWGTPTVSVAGQDPAAISFLSSVRLGPSERKDLIAIDSNGKIFAMENLGHTPFINGFDDYQATTSPLLFDFKDPQYSLSMANTKPVFTAMKTGDFDGNGCDDIAVGAVGYSNLGWGAPHTSLGLFVLWCVAPGQFAAEPVMISSTEIPLDIEWVDGTLYVLSQEAQTVPWTIPPSFLAAYRFSPFQPAVGTAPVLFSNQMALPVPGFLNSMAIADFTQDGRPDFVFASTNSFGNWQSSQAYLNFLPGAVGQPTLPGYPMQSLNVPPTAASSFDLQSLQAVDLNHDGLMDLAGLIAYGKDPTLNPSSQNAEVFYSYGPLAQLQNYSTLQTGGTFPMLASEWFGLYPQYRVQADALQFFDMDRDFYPDLIVAGLFRAGVSSHEIYKNTLGQVDPGHPRVEDFGTPDHAPHGPVRDLRIGIEGPAPQPGTTMEVVMKGLSPRQHIAFFYDYASVDLPGFPTPSLSGVPRPLWVGVLPAFTSNTRWTGTSPSGWGGGHGHVVREPLVIPNHPSLLGVEAYTQGFVFDEILGQYFSSQGVGFRVGQ